MKAQKSLDPKIGLAELRRSIHELDNVVRPRDERIKARIAKEIEKILEELRCLRDDVDPVLSPPAFLDPTHPLLIANFVGIALLAQPRRPLDNIERFHGSGVYAIYYKGKNRWYRPWAGTQHPIYLGKAAPKDFRAIKPRDQGTSIYERLMQHVATIKSGSGIKVSDFAYRFLAIHSGWELSAEAFLVDMYRPIWNGVVNGFGNHQPGGGRPGTKLAAWDALHPGRSWAKFVRSEDRKRREEVLGKLRKHLKKADLFKTKNQIMEHFFRNLREWRARSSTF